VHDVHVGEAPVEVEAGVEVGDGQRHVREAVIDWHRTAA